MTVTDLKFLLHQMDGSTEILVWMRNGKIVPLVEDMVKEQVNELIGKDKVLIFGM